MIFPSVTWKHHWTVRAPIWTILFDSYLLKSLFLNRHVCVGAWESTARTTWRCLISWWFFFFIYKGMAHIDIYFWKSKASFFISLSKNGFLLPSQKVWHPANKLFKVTVVARWRHSWQWHKNADRVVSSDQSVNPVWCYKYEKIYTTGLR